MAGGSINWGTYSQGQSNVSYILKISQNWDGYLQQ